MARVSYAVAVVAIALLVLQAESAPAETAQLAPAKKLVLPVNIAVKPKRAAECKDKDTTGDCEKFKENCKNKSSIGKRYLWNFNCQKTCGQCK